MLYRRLTVPANHWIILKEGEKRNKYLHFARELRKKKQKKTNKQRNMKLTLIPIVIGALDTVTKE